MINTPFVQRYQTYPLQMDAFECLKTSPPLPRCLLDIVEKVIRVVLIPFALIIDFFINLVRSIANTCISLANWVSGPVPDAPPIPVRSGENGALEIVVTPAVEVAEPVQSHAEEMPVPTINQLGNRLVPPLDGQIVADRPPAEVMREALPVSMTQLTTSVLSTGTSATNHISQITVTSPTGNGLPSNVGVSTTSSQSSTHTTTTTRASTATRKAATAAPPVHRTLAQLPCTQEQEGQIKKLLLILGTKGKGDILWNEKKSLSDLGAAIRDVHPLKFLSIALSTPEGIGHVQAIFADMFKRGSFMSYSNSTTPSFTCKLDAEAKKDNLAPYLTELVQGKNVDLAQIQKDVKEKKWDNLVKRLAGIQVPS